MNTKTNNNQLISSENSISAVFMFSCQALTPHCYCSEINTGLWMTRITYIKYFITVAMDYDPPMTTCTLSN